LMNPYDILAPFYDRFQDRAEPEAWAGFLNDLYEMYGPGAKEEKGEAPLALDLGCGTGQVALALSDMGYLVYAVDLSQGMLEEAAFLAQEHVGDGPLNIRFIHADIRDLEGFSDIKLAYTSLDTYNHLDEEGMLQSLASVVEALAPGGIFVMDLLRLGYMKESFGQSFYYDIGADYALLWENHYDEMLKKNRADISLFSLAQENEDGDFYLREDLEIEEYYHEPGRVLAELEKLGTRARILQLDEDRKEALGASARHFILAVKKG
jgi:SAM-dependent methyltransferase